MSGNGILSSTSISASGLAAERQRMEIVANNIANAHTTRSLNGGPYRRQHVVFAEMHDAMAPSLLGGGSGPAGVRVLGVAPDQTQFPEVYDPGHPDANADGYVQMPNVKLPSELVDLVTASRSYEANLKALTAFREMMEQTLSLLRGLG